LKRILFICMMCIAVSAPCFAYVNLDAYGVYTGMDTGKDQLGGGGAIGFSVAGDLSVLYRGMYTVASQRSTFFKVKRYDHMMQLAGLEYVWEIPFVHIGWRSSFMAGYSHTRLDVTDRVYDFFRSRLLFTIAPSALALTPLREARRLVDSGPALAFWTGFQLDFITYLSPFVDIGIYKSFYAGDLKSRNIIGFHCMLGLRLGLGRPDTLEY